MKLGKYEGSYGIKILLLSPFNAFLKTRMWIYSTFMLSKFKTHRRNIDKLGYTLTFNDDFDTLDKTVWRTDNWWGSRYHDGNIINKNEAPTLYFDDDYFEIDNSILKIKTNYDLIEIQHVDYSGKDYGKFTIPFRSGMLDSSNSFKQKHGYFEIRCKMPSSLNMWPAFWLASKESWPPEIDIFEVLTEKDISHSTCTNHWYKNENDKKRIMDGFKFKTPKLNEDFHIYSCTWDKDYIKVYFDDILVKKSATPPNFHYEMHLILNSAIIKNNTENMNIPNYFEIDYVRAYSKN